MTMEDMAQCDCPGCPKHEGAACGRSGSAYRDEGFFCDECDPGPADGEMDVKVQDLRVGAHVNLKTCPYLNGHRSAEFEYAVVMSVDRETANCVAVDYDGVDQAGYAVGTTLAVRFCGERLVAGTDPESFAVCAEQYGTEHSHDACDIFCDGCGLPIKGTPGVDFRGYTDSGCVYHGKECFNLHHGFPQGTDVVPQPYLRDDQ